DDLEGDAELAPEIAELAPTAAQEAGGLEQLRRLQGTALEVLLDGRLRPAPLAALERLAADETEGGVCQDSNRRAVARRRQLRERLGKTLLELLEVGVEPGGGPDGGDRAQRATPVWSATMPPAKSRQRISSNPASSRSFARSSGPGNRRTLAGRYE